MSKRPTLPRIARADVAELHREIERYLTAVDAFRAEGYEPTWSWRFGSEERA